MKTYEIEKKYRLKDPKALRRKLRQLGARKKGDGREENEFWDFKGRLRRQRLTLRLRRYGASEKLTLKGPRQRQSHGVEKRLELEMTVDFLTARAILRAAGFKPRLKYTKRRELYTVGKTEVTIDSLPKHGWFVEIEGALPAILSLEKKLGLAPADAEPQSYLALVLGKKR